MNFYYYSKYNGKSTIEQLRRVTFLFPPRHFILSDREEADYIRQTDEWKIVYPQRKETIERVFADAKENHGMRFTRLKGLVKNQHESLIIFSCHNLKKLGLCKRRMGLI